MLQIDSTIDAKLIEALGRIVILWAYVEMLSGVVLAHLPRADDGAVHVVTQNVSHAAITDCIDRHLKADRKRRMTTQAPDKALG